MLIKVVSLIVFAAILIYGGMALYRSGDGAVRTVSAVPMELYEGVATEGWVVRDEEVLVSPAGGAAIVAEEGTKVPAGALIARTYSTTADRRLAEEIHELELEARELETILGGKASASAGMEAVRALSAAVHSWNTDALASALIDVDAHVLQKREYSSETARSRLDTILQRITNLQSSGDRGTVTAASSGIFSAGADGYEFLGSQQVNRRLSIEEARELFAAPMRLVSGAFGRLVHGIRWYYVTVMDASSASRLIGRSSAVLSFSGSFNEKMTMSVVSVGQDYEGKSVVVFSSDRNLSDVVSLRNISGDVVFRELSGIRVPREAVHLYGQEKTPVVYTVSGLQADRTEITILAEDGDYYLVSADGALKVGAEIIVRAENLEDGAVIR